MLNRDRPRVGRGLAIVAGAFALLFTLLAWSGTAFAQTYPIQRPQTPSTWQQPNQACPQATPATTRALAGSRT